MIQLFFIILLSIFNIASWAVMFYRFKKLFNTDDIISETKANCDEILKDLIRNVDSNITLTDSKLESLKALINDADKRIKILMESKKSSVALSSLKTQLNSNLKRHPTSASNIRLSKAAATYESATIQENFVRDTTNDAVVELSTNKTPPLPKTTTPTTATKSKPVPNAAPITAQEEDNSIKITPTKSDAAIEYYNEYGDDFSKVGLMGNSNLQDTSNTIPNDDAPYNSDDAHYNNDDSPDTNDSTPDENDTPQVLNNVTVENVFSSSKDDKKNNVLRLFDAGFDIDAISQKLSCSTTEVQFILDIEGRI